jgi:hypothetical protein
MAETPAPSRAQVDTLVSQLYCQAPVGLDAELAAAFEAVAIAIRECSRLVHSLIYLWQSPREYLTLAQEVHRTVEGAKTAYYVVDTRLRRVGGPNPMLDALNDALTVRTLASLHAQTVAELNPILTQIYHAKVGLFSSQRGRGIIDRILDQLAKCPPPAVRPAQAETSIEHRAAAERPSPFTIPQPTIRFFSGPAAEQPPLRSMTVRDLIQNLTVFADFYEQSSADIDRSEAVLRPHAVGIRDSQADVIQRAFHATVAIDRVRTYVIAQYKAELAFGTAQGLLADLVRKCGLTADTAEALTLEEAMDRLDGAGGTTTESINPGPPSTMALLSVFTNGITDDRIKQAERILSDTNLTVNDKLTKIDGLLPFPATASAEKLGKLFGVKKQAVLKTAWWIQNRKGEKASEVGRRRAGHKNRAKEFEIDRRLDDNQ